jgi:hypothetical protein
MVAKVNNWPLEQKGLYLAVSLRGQAQAILGDLPHEDQSSYDILVNALEERFVPPSLTELYRVQFRERKKKASESLPELGQVLRRLSNLAYSTAPRDVRETLAKEQFIDALHDSDMRLKVTQSRPRNLDDAIKLSVELEAFNKAEESNRTSRGYLRSADSNNRDDENKLNLSANSIAIEKLEKGMNSMQDMIKQLTEEIGKFKQNSRSTYTPESKERNCYNCGASDHLFRNCKFPPRENMFKNQQFGNEYKSDRYGSSRVIQRRNKQTKPNVSIIDEAGMIGNLEIVVARIQNAGLKLKAKKCCLCSKEVQFLGHVISETGVATDPSKIEVINNWPTPTSVTELRSFLGLCGYYRRYIKDFSAKAKCLHL